MKQGETPILVVAARGVVRLERKFILIKAATFFTKTAIINSTFPLIRIFQNNQKVNFQTT
ncbi:hypothetical protein FZC78_02330 [Rossellomorea vietnamensis]|uniref:Uncharacterized protein n=1 Tax=Rossellomorea vietnamensis TaxID=218284 RepID=A0A5D4P051_9BACI|nr:hypothetical protein [Rossellomorea vietnamensis]TYS19883.1 hypothetical protein FZC78_02330 [Rossellomorea vietnamensis]